MARYTVGSIIAAATSEITLVVLFGTGLLGATWASVVAFFAGAIPNYVLNRYWVWKRRGPIQFRQELGPYILVSLLSLAAATAATSWAASVAPHGQTLRVLFVGAAYLATYGVLFVLKFVVYQVSIFAGADEGPLQG
jgi:putative flippase GtrA